MKHHKEHHHKHRATGGVNEAEEDLMSHPEERTNAKEVDHEAEERKHGGHVKRKHKRARKHGGDVQHEGHSVHDSLHKHGHDGVHHAGPDEHKSTLKRKRGGHVKKHVGHMEGEHAHHHAGRKPRKSGGRTGSDTHPFSSARHGTVPKGRGIEMEYE